MGFAVITFAVKTISHDKFLADLGYSVRRKSGVWQLFGPAGQVDDQGVIDSVQAQLDGYDPLPDERARLGKILDTAAGEARARYITVSPGQEITYELKRIQAEAHKEAGYPADLTAYPMIAAEATAMSGTAQEATDYILNKSAQWQQVAALVEENRRGAKVSMEADQTVPGIEAIAQSALAILETI